MNTCTCGKPTRDNAYVCEDDLTLLAKALGDIPWIDEQLEITLSKQKAATSGGGASNERPSPMHAGAFEARRNLRHTLVTWIKFCTEEQIRHSSTDDWPADTVVAMSRWLMWRVDGLAFNDLGSDVVREITGSVRDAHRVVDRPAERRYAGPCECGRDLYHKPGAKDAKCRACARVYPAAELYEWMQDQMDGRLVTAREGATLLCRFGIETHQRTIDKWHARKRIVSKGEDATGKRMYLFDDLMELAGRSA